MTKKIVVIPGDGIGKEITESAVAVLKRIDEKFKLGLEFSTFQAGGTAYDLYGTPLPEQTIEAAKAADGVLFGAVGGDKWDDVEPALRPERAILGLRKELGLYANLRPVKVADSLIEYSPLKAEVVRGIDIMIVRELIGGVYFGEKCESEIKDGHERAWDLENYSVPEVERIMKLAFDTAKLRRGKVTSVDKANVLATSRLWRRTAAKVAAGYPEVKMENMYVDNCAMQIVKNPAQFDVIVTENMFGDILSDEASMITGSIGMIPSSSLGDGTRGLYEPIHGSAPDIAGKDIVNPTACILSAAMMLRYSFGMAEEADAIENAVNKVLDKGLRTADNMSEGCTCLGCTAMGDAILAEI